VVKDEAELEIYVDALDPLKSSLGEVNPEVGLTYTKIGYLYGKKRDQSLSLLAYKAALKAYGEPSSIAFLGGMHPEVLSVWVCVTEHLYSMKSWREVLVAGERTLFFLRLAKKSLFRDVELYTKHNNSRASSSSDTASVNSIPIVKTNKKSPIQVTSATYYDSLYTTFSSLAQAHLVLQNYQLARDACQESLQLGWEIALSSQHDNKAKGSSQEPLDPAILTLIRALKRLGKVLLLQKHYNDALDCFLPCIELLRSTKTTESTVDAASVLGSLGFLYLKLKRFSEASNFLRECLRLYRMNGVDVNDRETRKVKAWLEMAESREEGFEEPPTFLEIPIVI
jgi:tetratricopeptide (TPR) repeat protein